MDSNFERSIIKFGNSRSITIPPTFAVGDSKVVIRYTKYVMLVTPRSIDEQLIITGKIFKEIDKIIKSINKEREILLEIGFLQYLLKNEPNNKTLQDKIFELKQRLKKLKSSHDENES